MDTSPRKLRGFQDIVEQAISDPDNNGLRFLPHYSSRLSSLGETHKVCDAAVIYKEYRQDL